MRTMAKANFVIALIDLYRPNQLGPGRIEAAVSFFCPRSPHPNHFLSAGHRNRDGVQNVDGARNRRTGGVLTFCSKDQLSEMVHNRGQPRGSTSAFNQQQTSGTSSTSSASTPRFWRLAAAVTTSAPGLIGRLRS